MGVLAHCVRSCAPAEMRGFLPSAARPPLVLLMINTSDEQQRLEEAMAVSSALRRAAEEIMVPRLLNADP